MEEDEEKRVRLEVLCRELQGKHYVWQPELSLVSEGHSQEDAIRKFRQEVSVRLEVEPGYIGITVRGTF